VEDPVLHKGCRCCKPQCPCDKRNATEIAEVDKEREEKGCAKCDCDKRNNGAEAVSSMAGLGAAGAAVAFAVGALAFL
jgi:hypothetical protein